MLRNRVLALAAILAPSSALAIDPSDITPETDAAALADALFGPGVNVLSASGADLTYDWVGVNDSNGDPASDPMGPSSPSAIYTNGPLSIADGVVLSTGLAAAVAAPNQFDFNSGINPAPTAHDGFILCNSIVPGFTVFDATLLTVEFTLDEGYDGIQLSYVFGSEEYSEFVGSSFADAVGAFVSTNGGPATNFALDNDENPIDINGPFFSSSAVVVATETEMDGSTPRLTSRVPLATGPSNVHTLELVICDAGDNAYDSSVFVSTLAGCVGACEGTTSCGDSSVDTDVGETCDDGNNTDGDGCDNTCQLEDSDNDGLPNELEGVVGTDPNEGDTDRDGLLDGTEYFGNGVLALFGPTNPLDFDSDDDGLRDGDEANMSSNPNDAMSPYLEMRAEAGAHFPDVGGSGTNPVSPSQASFVASVQAMTGPLYASGCVVDGWVAGAYGQSSHSSADQDGEQSDEVLTRNPNRFGGRFSNGFAYGRPGQFSTWNGAFQIYATREDGGFVAGTWVRNAGNRGTHYLLHGSCPLAVDPRDVLDPWFVGAL